MWSTPNSTARRRTATAASRSAGGPITCGPASCIAPYPTRWTVRSPRANWPDFSAVKVMPPSPPRPASMRGPGREFGSGLQQDLDVTFLLLPEVLVGLRCVLERDVVGGELVHAQGVAVEQQRQDVGHPAPHVGLAHAPLDL